jgi:hypothetical protein
MTGDKTARDRSNNERFKDIYVHASQEPWIPFFPGIDFKVLRATQETGHWTVLLKCAKGGLAYPGTNILEPANIMWSRAKWK